MERTLAIIKPDSVGKKLIGEIISMISSAGFSIIGLKLIRLNKQQASEFYAIHKGKPFFDGLIDFMSSGAIVAIALEKDNAVADFRKLIGNTDPALAEVGTIRRKYAESKSINAVHGSDSLPNAEIELKFFFNQMELTN